MPTACRKYILTSIILINGQTQTHKISLLSAQWPLLCGCKGLPAVQPLCTQRAALLGRRTNTVLVQNGPRNPLEVVLQQWGTRRLAVLGWLTWHVRGKGLGTWGQLQAHSKGQWRPLRIFFSGQYLLLPRGSGTLVDFDFPNWNHLVLQVKDSSVRCLLV